ncbi:MAG: hypothetical protein ACR2LL_02075 [Nitrosopumilus sp.]
MPNARNDLRHHDLQKNRSPTVDILKPEIYQWLSQKAEKENTSLRRLVNNLLETYKEKEEFISGYITSIKKIGFEDGLLYLRDNEMKKTITVSLLNGFIQCDLCDSKDCIHILYAMTLPEIARLESVASKTRKK